MRDYLETGRLMVEFVLGCTILVGMTMLAGLGIGAILRLATGG